MSHAAAVAATAAIRAISSTIRANSRYDWPMSSTIWPPMIAPGPPVAMASLIPSAAELTISRAASSATRPPMPSRATIGSRRRDRASVNSANSTVAMNRMITRASNSET